MCNRNVLSGPRHQPRGRSIRLGVTLALFLSSCKAPAPPPRVRPVNLVLVTIDTLRADRLGCYGYSQIETPNLDRIARRGVLFESAVTHTPLTAPSHASI